MAEMPVLGPDIKNLLEEDNCNSGVAALDTCITIQNEQPSNLISKQPVDIVSNSIGTEPALSSSSTLDTESFHTVCNDSSSGSVVEANPIQPCSITEPSEPLEAAVNHAEANSKAFEVVDMKTCTINVCGDVLTIQSADAAAVSCPSYFHY